MVRTSQLSAIQDASSFPGKTGWRGLLMLLVFGLVTSSAGCSFKYKRRKRYRYQSRFRHAPSSERAPRLRQSAEEIEAALKQYPRTLRERQTFMSKAIAQPAADDFAAQVNAIDWCYRNGTLRHAETLLKNINQAGKLAVYDFDNQKAVDSVHTKVEYRKLGRGGSLFVTVRRRVGVKKRLAVAFPPGTFARPFVAPSNDDLYKDWPPARRGNVYGTSKSQDLVFLSARIAWLDEGVEEVELRFPVACGRFAKGAPKNGERFLLARFDRQSPMEQLAAEIAVRGLYGADSQLAIWIVRDELTWAQFDGKRRQRGNSVTFETNETVTPRSAYPASVLMLQAGLDPRSYKFFEVNQWNRASSQSESSNPANGDKSYEDEPAPEDSQSDQEAPRKSYSNPSRRANKAF